MKKLIIYYSYTGNTKIIADMIKERLNYDVLQLQPQVPFSTDYDEVVRIYQNNSLHETVAIKDIDVDLNQYDEIILGSPVWWYTLCPVVTTFLKTYDLTGKTIIPYATNAGWLGHTFKDIKKLCPNSTVKNEKNIVFESYSSKLKTTETEINQWINKIGG